MSLYPFRLRAVSTSDAAGDLNRDLSSIYDQLWKHSTGPLILWGTSKNVMELFDCLVEPVDMICSELYSILYTPFLICHNMAEEQEQEGFSEAFRAFVADLAVIRQEELGTALLPVFQLFRSRRECVARQGAGMMSARRKQLSSLLRLYGEMLPKKIEDAYKELESDSGFWRTSENAQ